MTGTAGVMLYTVDALLDDALEATLERIADIGYLAVETYGLHGRTPRAFRAAADAAGLAIVSSHVPFPAGADGRRALDAYAELGVDTLAWSLEADEFVTSDAVDRGLERVNAGVEQAAEYGISIAVHNHLAEFTNRFGSRPAYAWLQERVDPRAVFELDLYWVQKAGASPADTLRSLAGRVPLVHVKDGPAAPVAADATASYYDDVLTPVGAGALDIDAALTANDAVRWHLVELERLDVDVFDALRISYDHLVGHGLSVGSRTVEGGGR